MTGLRNLLTARVAIYKDLCGFCTKLPKAQHRGHKESQRATEKLAVGIPFCIPRHHRQTLSALCGFLRVLCVKFRKARPTICAPCKHFDAIPWPNTRSPLPCGRESTMLRVYG